MFLFLLEFRGGTGASPVKPRARCACHIQTPFQSTSIERTARFGNFLFRGPAPRLPEKSLEITATTLIKLNAFVLQHPLLLI
jgi:hypothetical protein